MSWPQDDGLVMEIVLGMERGKGRKKVDGAFDKIC